MICMACNGEGWKHRLHTIHRKNSYCKVCKICNGTGRVQPTTETDNKTKATGEKDND